MNRKNLLEESSIILIKEESSLDIKKSKIFKIMNIYFEYSNQ
jgi:hypothetical protein